MSNDMSGAIFRNKRKEKENHPDRTGTCTIGGVEYWISGWMKEKNGEPYMSLSFKPKEAQQPREREEARKPAPPGRFDSDDQIPF
jgi:hypothetical protein